ncbi:MAG: hemolysin-type calcium-binding region [Rhodobacter sp. CACIA14H1]|nr:MAG: hemolysin-type calcium-binding region [Rhodobacter sp. CACIA14H1]
MDVVSDCGMSAPGLLEAAPEVFARTELACLVRGTRVETAAGLVAVEDIRDGMLVETMDNGLQPVRRVLSKVVDGTGALAPVVFDAGVLGNARSLRVSPHHRMMVTGWRAELATGEPEILVEARHLVDRAGVRVEPVASVEYFHLLFDRHEIVFAEGAPTESYHPFAADAASLSPATLAEIVAIFPQAATALQACRPVRPCADAAEAALLLA